MIYALYTYHWRAASIRRGGKGPYDDRLGPVSFGTARYCPSISNSSDRLDYSLYCTPWYVPGFYKIFSTVLTPCLIPSCCNRQLRPSFRRALNSDLTRQNRREHPIPPLLPSIYFFISTIPLPDSIGMSSVSLHFGRDGYACKMRETDRCVFSCIYIQLIHQLFFRFRTISLSFQQSIYAMFNVICLAISELSISIFFATKLRLC